MSRRSFFLLVLLASGSVLAAMAVAMPVARLASLFQRTKPAQAALMPLTTAQPAAQNPKQ